MYRFALIKFPHYCIIVFVVYLKYHAVMRKNKEFLLNEPGLVRFCGKKHTHILAENDVQTTDYHGQLMYF